MPSFKPVLHKLVVLLTLCGGLLMGQQPLSTDPTLRECDPVLTYAGDVLYFTRVDHPRNQGTEDYADIWMRRREKNGWGRALNPGSPINSFGHDRLLGASVDGKRLAVLRTGAVCFLDLLERNGRSWVVVDSWTLPEDVTERTELAFNVNSEELIYTCREAGGTSSDLCSRQTRAGGQWGERHYLNNLNSSEHEGSPVLAADGRTLYFRRGNDQWLRQPDRGERAEAVDIAPRYRQLALAATTSVVMTNDLGQEERLFSVPLPEVTLPPAGTVTQATLGTPPAPGERMVDVPLNNELRLRVRPDVLDRYTIVLREGEIDFPRSVIPTLSNTRPPGSLAGRREVATDKREEYLLTSIADGQRELTRLDELRKRSYTDAPLTDDPERAALRNRLREANELNGDTLPPASDTRARYAQDLTELERMKEKFRRQQEERLRQRDRGGRLDLGWSNVPPEDTVRNSTRDTTVVKSTIRTNLTPQQRTTPYTRREWENTVSGDLPRQEPLTEKEAARLDDEYAAQQREIEALRARLREVRPAAPAVVSDVKSPVTNAGVTFIPNTAYPNSGGYAALDELALLVQRSSTVVEIRVHVAPDLEGRAAQRLSEERAVSIRDHLTRSGIARENFRVIGYGNHEPEGGERVEVIE